MSCPACPTFPGGVCPLCECGLQPIKGLNEKILLELAGFLWRGSHDAGRKPGESILGHAARLVRQSEASAIDECPGCGGLPHPDGSASYDPCAYDYGVPVLTEGEWIPSDRVTSVSMSEVQTTALVVARKRGVVSVEDGFTSELLGNLQERGFLKAVTLIDGKVMSAAPVSP